MAVLVDFPPGPVRAPEFRFRAVSIRLHLAPTPTLLPLARPNHAPTLAFNLMELGTGNASGFYTLQRHHRRASYMDEVNDHPSRLTHVSRRLSTDNVVDVSESNGVFTSSGNRVRKNSPPRWQKQLPGCQFSTSAHVDVSDIEWVCGSESDPLSGDL